MPVESAASTLASAPTSHSTSASTMARSLILNPTHTHTEQEPGQAPSLPFWSKSLHVPELRLWLQPAQSLAPHLWLYPELSGPGVASKMLEASVQRTRAPDKASVAEGKIAIPVGNGEGITLVGPPWNGTAEAMAVARLGTRVTGTRMCRVLVPKPYSVWSAGRALGTGLGSWPTSSGTG